MIENNDAPTSELFFKKALLPYNNIKTFDLNSDEDRPIFYCIYDGLLGPFDEVYWVHE